MVALVVTGGLIIRFIDSAPGANGPVATARVYETGTGERDSLRLADGTFVLLGPGSELALADGYGVSNREVSLQGEAFFDVDATSDAGVFTVLVGDVRIEDLGTAFVVRTGERSGLRVGVSEGRVVVRVPNATPNDGLMLAAGDAAEIAATNEVIRGALVPDVDLEWRDGLLAFREAPLSRVRFDLRRWYGIELQIDDDALENRHLTASFGSESVGEVGQIIALAIGGVVEVRGDTIAITLPAGAAAP
jgi:transmembrane sensor